VVTVTVVALLIAASWPRGNDPGSTAPPLHTRATTAGRVNGSPNAPVKIVEFGDYQCPYCRRFWEQTEPVLQREFIDAGIVSLEFRDLTVVGPESETAALGAACAADQDMFWPMHDVLYGRQGRENSGVYSSANVKRFAREAASAAGNTFDPAQFDACLDSRAHLATLRASNTAAGTMQVKATPSFLVNGTLVTGAVSMAELRELINAARAAAR
jgi:protein-disulfide isomerase